MSLAGGRSPESPQEGNTVFVGLLVQFSPSAVGRADPGLCRGLLKAPNRRSTQWSLSQDLLK